MFTGLVEEMGTVLAFAARPGGWRLRVAARAVRRGLAVGDSLAVNGCCLTVVKFASAGLEFDLLEETRRRTSFAELAPGSGVNLERSLRFDGKLGGHFVTGHIDGLGQVEVSEPRGRDHYLRIRVPAGGRRYLIPKGSIAVDGISLTLAEVTDEAFAVWIIPHTWRATNVREKKAGDGVNLEFDLLGKYVERLLQLPPENAKRPHRAHRRAAPTQGGGGKNRRRLG